MSINKQEVFDKCLDEVNRRIEKYQREMKLIQRTREASEPSTDPDEKGGAGEMMGDTETVANHLSVAREMKEELANLNLRTTSDHIKQGSIVETEKNYYFISTALGKVELDDGRSVYAISDKAPIYEKMEGRKAGESFDFNETTFNIKEVH